MIPKRRHTCHVPGCDPMTGRPLKEKPAALRQPPGEGEPVGLFAQTHAKRSDPEPSHQAAHSVAKRSARQMAAVLAILERGPISTHDMRVQCMALEPKILHPGARILDLRNAGYEIETAGSTYILKSKPAAKAA